MALPPILATITSWPGPHRFLRRPMISIGTGSGSVPWKTVQAVAFMPGLTSLRGRISTLPALGREGVAFSAAHTGNAKADTPKRRAAKRVFMGSTAPVIQLYYQAPTGSPRAYRRPFNKIL